MAAVNQQPMCRPCQPLFLGTIVYRVHTDSGSQELSWTVIACGLSLFSLLHHSQGLCWLSQSVYRIISDSSP